MDSGTQARITKCRVSHSLNEKVSQHAGTKSMLGDRPQVTRWWVALKAGAGALPGVSRVCHTEVWISWSFKSIFVLDRVQGSLFMAYLNPLPHPLEDYVHVLFQRPHNAEENTAPGAERPGCQFQVGRPPAVRDPEQAS